MSARDLQDDLREQLRRRRLRRLTSDGGLGGRSGLVAPRIQGRRVGAVNKLPIVMPEPLTRGGQVVGSAQLLVMEATGDSIAAGGDSIVFGVVLDRHGFDGATAGATWVHPTGGTYSLVFKGEWSSAVTGTIRLLLDGVSSASGELVSGSGDDVFAVLLYRATEGAIGEIEVDHSEPTAQSFDARVAIMISDPDPVVISSDWELVFAADAWGITNDGTSWYTTLGQNGSTVTKRDTDGSVLSTFDAAAVAGEPERARGITFDGADLWVVGNAEAVARYSTAGVEEATFDLTSSWADELSVLGIAHDGTDLWITGQDTNELRRYSTAGGHELTVDLVSGSHAGVTVYNSTVYVVDRTNRQLRTFTLAGGEGTAVDISDAPINPHGVWIAGDGTLYLSQDGTGVYRWTGGAL